MKQRHPVHLGNLFHPSFLRPLVVCLPALFLLVSFLVPLTLSAGESDGWSQKYEANESTPDRETRSGWNITEKAGKAVVADGVLSIATPNERAFYYFHQKDSRDAWGRAAVPNRDWAIEVRAKVLDNGGPDGGLTIWAGNGTAHSAYCTIRKDSITWGFAKTGQQILARGMDNASAFHNYTVRFDAASESFIVERDGRTVRRDLPVGVGYSERWLIVGDTGASGWVRAQIDHIRWVVGKTRKLPSKRAKAASAKAASSARAPAPAPNSTARRSVVPAPGSSVVVAAPPVKAGPKKSDTVRIIAFGDSVTKAHGVKKSFCDYLTAALRKKKIKHEILNNGMPAATTIRSVGDTPYAGRHALDRLPSIRAQNPDLVIVQFGINDSWIDNGTADGLPRVSLTDYQENLIQIVRAFQDDGANVVLIGPNPIGDRKVEKWRDQRTEPYSRGAIKVGSITGVPVVSARRAFAGYKGDVDFLLADSVHPNHFGHERIANALIPIVLRQLGRGTVRKIDASNDLKPVVAAVTDMGACLGADTLRRGDGSVLAAALLQLGKSGTPFTQLLLSRDGGGSWSSVQTPAALRSVKGTGSLMPTGEAGEFVHFNIANGDLAAAFGSSNGSVWKPSSTILRSGIDVLSAPRQMVGRPDGGRLVVFPAKSSSGKTGLYKSIAADADTWSSPTLAGRLPEAPADPALFRTADGALHCLVGDADGKGARLIKSVDHGRTWSAARSTHDSIHGTGHRLITTPGGDAIALLKDAGGDIQLWVGRTSDLALGRPALARIRLYDNPGRASGTSTAGLETLANGDSLASFVAPSKRWGTPAFMSLRFDLDELLAP